MTGGPLTMVSQGSLFAGPNQKMYLSKGFVQISRSGGFDKGRASPLKTGRYVSNKKVQGHPSESTV